MLVIKLWYAWIDRIIRIWVRHSKLWAWGVGTEGRYIIFILFSEEDKLVNWCKWSWQAWTSPNSEISRISWHSFWPSILLKEWWPWPDLLYVRGQYENLAQRNQIWLYRGTTSEAKKSVWKLWNNWAMDITDAVDAPETSWNIQSCPYA